mgnify:FL=1
MVNFNWTFNIQNTVPYSLETQNSNVIKTIGWNIIGKDSENEIKQSSVGGSIDFDISSLSDFKEINQISNDDLKSWVISVEGQDKIDKMKQGIVDNIDSLPEDFNPTPNA